jgi:hypothetical protein
VFTAKLHAASRRNPRESTYDERVFWLRGLTRPSRVEHPRTCWNPVDLYTSHAWRDRQTKSWPKLLSFHVLSRAINRSPAWIAASDDERKSQEFRPTCKTRNQFGIHFHYGSCGEQHITGWEAMGFQSLAWNNWRGARRHWINHFLLLLPPFNS